MSLFAISCYLATTAVATPTCKEALAAADKTIADKNKTIESKNKTIELKDLAIKDCANKNSYLQTEYDKEKSKNQSIFKNPFAMVLLGIAAGAASVYIIERR